MLKIMAKTKLYKSEPHLLFALSSLHLFSCFFKYLCCKFIKSCSIKYTVHIWFGLL